MNSKGYTKDNIHQGTTRVVAGDLEVDGDLIVSGDLKVNNIEVNNINVNKITADEICIDGYCLPTSGGTPGQVITMNPDGTTTSFKDAGGNGSMTLIGSGDGGSVVVPVLTDQVIPSSYIGTKDISINDFPVGSSFVVEGESIIKYFYDGTSPSVQTEFNINFNVYSFGVVSNNLLTTNTVNPTITDGTTIGTNFFSFWKFRGIFTRTDNNELTINTHTQLSKFSNPQDYRVMPNKNPDTTPQTLIFDPSDNTIQFSFNLSAENKLGAGVFLTFQESSIIWYVAQLGQVNPPQLLTNDHTQLTNLNVGDAGHSQFALLQGRDNGQILSGGILPFHNLTLKAHNIGLPNVVVRDINTRFDKNIDLNNNSIENVLDINNNLIQFNSVGNSVKINSNPTENINITADGDLLLKSINNFLDIDSNIIRIISTGTPQAQIDAVGGIELLNNLNMTTNNILNAGQIGCDKIDGANGYLDFNATAGTPPFTIPAMELKTNPGGRLNIQADTESINIIGTTITNRTDIQQFLDSGNNALLTLTPLQIDVSKNINMNNNDITSGGYIYANRLLTSDIESTSGFITIFGLGGGITPSFTPSGLDMNLGTINNVDTIENTGNNNITLPIVIGTPSGALQIKNGGAYIKQDLQVDGNIYCSNINNIKPSGGVYSESSGFSVLASTLTETNLLGQGGSSGSLSVPSGGFNQYDSYSFKASGVLSGGTNDTFTLRLKSNVAGVGSVEFGAIPVQLSDNGLVNVWWDIVADFNVRTTGIAGVGVLVLSGAFRYTNTNDVVRIYGRTIIDNTNFDTTKDNTLELTYQNDATNPLTSFRIDSCSFTKWF